MPPIDEAEAQEMKEDSEPTEALSVRLPKSLRERIRDTAQAGAVTETLLVKRILRSGLPEWERVWKSKK